MGFNNQQIKSATVNNVALNNNALTADYSYKDYSGQDLSKLLITIRLKGNGYEYAFEDVFSFTISNQKLTLSNFKSQSKGEFVYVDASGDSTSTIYTLSIPAKTKIVVFSGSSSKTYKVDINVDDSNNELLVIYKDFDAKIGSGDNLLYCAYDRKITARFYGYNTINTSGNPRNSAIINVKELDLLVKSGSLTMSGYDSSTSNGGKCIKSDNLTVQGTVYLYGGDGADNKTTGGAGYTDGDAIYVTKSLYLACSGEIKGGTGGVGGVGGKGHNDDSANPFGGVGKPGDGGKGGTGGTGGAGGNGQYAVSSKTNLGTRGDGGDGGKGGKGGTGGKGGSAGTLGGGGKGGAGGAGGNNGKTGSKGSTGSAGANG